ncbi:MAG TPA: putative quinol monooxygenase [Acidobacteriota bacterium]|jgi:quinol monooxygenase YgiN
MANKNVTVLARVKAKKGMEDRVRLECLELVASSRKDRGCISYHLHRSTDDPALFVFYENWTNRKHVEKHLEKPHSLAFDKRTNGMLAEPEEITFLELIS